MAMNIKIILITIIFFLTNCGFKPIYYSKDSDQSGHYGEELVYVKIKKYRQEIDHKLYENLHRILNPYKLQTKKKYLLDVKLSDRISSTFTTSSGSSGRNKVILTANYSLSDIVSGDILGSGTVSENSDFDVENKRFANYITEEQIKFNLTKLIAKDIRNMIINDINQISE